MAKKNIPLQPENFELETNTVSKGVVHNTLSKVKCIIP